MNTPFGHRNNAGYLVARSMPGPSARVTTLGFHLALELDPHPTIILSFL
jgi:hypothetical protein